jgi:hypothetical protein
MLLKNNVRLLLLLLLPTPLALRSYLSCQVYALASAFVDCLTVLSAAGEWSGTQIKIAMARAVHKCA